MIESSHNSKSFPLTLDSVIGDYRRLPADTSGVFYHYTTHSGLEGILREGGLRAGYRMTMNDPAEFSYAKDVICGSLEQVRKSCKLGTIGRSLAACARKNLANLLKDTTELG